jgi:hypothetical protein
MTAKYLLCSVMLGIALAGSMAATAKNKKRQKCNFMLIEAYHKTTAVGEGNPPMTGDHFIIKWNDTNYPETFFWRGDNGWLSCKIVRAHKAGKMMATTDDANGDQVHKGDTLMLSPVTGGRFPIPKEIPTSAKNTLFYKVNGSAWLSCKVKSIAKK